MTFSLRNRNVLYVNAPESTTILKRLDVPEGVRDHRELAGLTLTEVAQRVGIAKGYLSEMERGIKPLRPDMVVRIAKAIHQERP